jgi:hypothetical protein
MKSETNVMSVTFAYWMYVPTIRTPTPLPLYRVHVTVGFASKSGAMSFEAAGDDLSFYTRALVKMVDAFGHSKDVVQLLEEVRAEVIRQSSALGVTQTPCAYSAKEGRVVLVSLVGSTPLSAGAVVTVGDAVRPLLNHFEPQVSQHAFSRCKVWTLKQCLGLSG